MSDGNEGAGIGFGVSAEANIVRGGGERPLLGAQVRCFDADGNLKWEDSVVFFDPAASFRVNAAPAPVAEDDNGSGRD